MRYRPPEKEKLKKVAEALAKRRVTNGQEGEEDAEHLLGAYRTCESRLLVLDCGPERT